MAAAGAAAPPTLPACSYRRNQNTPLPSSATVTRPTRRLPAPAVVSSLVVSFQKTGAPLVKVFATVPWLVSYSTGSMLRMMSLETLATSATVNPWTAHPNQPSNMQNSPTATAAAVAAGTVTRTDLPSETTRAMLTSPYPLMTGTDLRVSSLLDAVPLLLSRVSSCVRMTVSRYISPTNFLKLGRSLMSATAFATSSSPESTVSAGATNSRTKSRALSRVTISPTTLATRTSC